MFGAIRVRVSPRLVVRLLRISIPRALQKWLTAILITFLVLWFWGLAMAQSEPVVESGVPVILDSQTILVVQDRFLARSIEERAERITTRLIQFAENESIELDALQTQNLENATLIHAEDFLLMTISEQDGKLAGKEYKTLANEYLQKIRRAVQEYRQERSLTARTQASIIAIIGSIALIVSWLILHSLMPRFYRMLDRQRNQRIPNIQIQNLELISSDQLSDLLLGLTSLVRFFLSLTLVYIYFSFVFRLFPKTRELSRIMSGYFKNALYASWKTFLDYFPNLLIIGFIIASAYFLLKFLKVIFSGINRQVFSIPGFYPEWAEPTYKLCSYLVFAVSAAIIFPYLPGSSSPAFQAISLVLGAMVSLGATGAVSNMVAGYVLIYTRSFQLSDLIKVGDVIGIVEEKSLLVTRIRTWNNELVTLPNSVLLNSNITNYRALLRDNQIPLILATTITLGYDIPWRKIHQTLIAAALATPDILSDPSPFVLQTALNDFYISYELKAFTHNPENILEIYSALHQNIQDKCNEADIEICSPHYSALRDGNHNTIPANYLPSNYVAPGFRVTSLKNFLSGQTSTSDD
jgi:small-conductance mechanosensitive channel